MISPPRSRFSQPPKPNARRGRSRAPSPSSASPAAAVQPNRGRATLSPPRSLVASKMSTRSAPDASPRRAIMSGISRRQSSAAKNALAARLTASSTASRRFNASSVMRRWVMSSAVPRNPVNVPVSKSNTGRALIRKWQTSPLRAVMVHGAFRNGDRSSSLIRATPAEEKSPRSSNGRPSISTGWKPRASNTLAETNFKFRSASVSHTQSETSRVRSSRRRRMSTTRNRSAKPSSARGTSRRWGGVGRGLRSAIQAAPSSSSRIAAR